MSTLNPTPSLPKKAENEQGLIPEAVKTALIVVLLLAVAYLFYAVLDLKKTNQTILAKLAEQVQALETANKNGEVSLSKQISILKGDLAGTIDEVGTAKAEAKRTAAQLQAESQRTKKEFSQALSVKADASQVEAQVQAAKSEAESKIGQVNSEVGGVKSQVAVVRTDLDNARRDLEGTQRQLVDVRDSLSAAVAKNSSELVQLRLKGEREYIEFTIPKKNEILKVEDIRLLLMKTDPKKGKFNLKVMVDDNRLEKKDKLINEPVQFLVGRNHVRYEIVINWVDKNRAGGYLSIPKDKALSAEYTGK